MQSRKIGPFEVSAIGMGCMNISAGYGPADDRESERLMLGALDAGYTFFDTAAMYGMGHSEELIGRTLSHRRDEFTLASKCGIFKGASGLQTDVIDLYYLHRIDPNVPVEESVGTLSELVLEGKIKTIGLSEVSTASLRRAHAIHPITALQSEYSLWARTPERQILAACKELGVVFVPFSPLARSFLTGESRDVTSLPDDDIRATIARPRFEPENFAQNVKLLAPFKGIAQEQGCSMAQLALAWILARADGTMIPIPGTRSMEHMQDNAGAGDIQLDAAAVAALDGLINEGTVAGDRYIERIMTSIDSEKD